MKILGYSFEGVRRVAEDLKARLEDLAFKSRERARHPVYDKPGAAYLDLHLFRQIVDPLCRADPGERKIGVELCAIS